MSVVITALNTMLSEGFFLPRSFFRWSQMSVLWSRWSPARALCAVMGPSYSCKTSSQSDIVIRPRDASRSSAAICLLHGFKSFEITKMNGDARLQP